MNDDAAAAQHGRRISTVGRVHLVVVHQPATRVVPDAEAELVRAAAAVHLPINRRQHEAVIARIVDLAGAFVLRPRSGDHQPLIHRALEVQIARLELELGVAGWHAVAVLVLRDEAEVGFASQQQIGRVRARR